MKSISTLLAICTLHSSLLAGELIPFILPWNDDTPGITDLSGMNHKPAGKHGYITIDDQAHFTVGGERIRFWGVNFVTNTPFIPNNEADGVAPRLAKFGFNIVRFHHMDNNWGGSSLIDYSQGNSRELHTDNLDRLDYLIAKLKENGIYTNINLINARDFKVADGLDPQIEANLEWKERHVIGFVDETFRDLEKEYARKLLTHTNPYTGLTYAEDPAIAVVEVNNENGIFHQYYGGSLEKWPQAYKDQLNTKWNSWLSNRYADTAELLDAWSGESEAFGPEILSNPTFENGTSDWNSEQHGDSAVTTTTGEYEGRQGVKIDVTTTSTTNWHGQLNQSGVSLTKDQLYTFSFWARADQTRNFSANIGLAYSPYSSVHSFGTFEATTEWQQFTFTFNGGTTDNNLRVNFSNYIGDAGAIYFSGISLKTGADLSASLPNGETLEAENIASNSNSGSYLPNRKTDWARFLIHLATEYWTDMRDYIRNDLGYGGMINGTTIMNSTPNIQGVYELVDTHAYWQHPIFPGNPWDPNNWTVNPISMVNTMDNTLSGLAKQRVEGYPHTVSEYQHSFPNPFASEGPLMAATYAALQDWDGIYFFEYGRGQNGWDQGYWDGYFNMANHPSAMANALAGAQIFRGNHVSAATGQLLMNFDPELEAEIVANQGRAWQVGDGRNLDIDNAHVFTQRVSLSIGDSPTGLDEQTAVPAGPVFTSDTNEISWDRTFTNKGVITVNTGKTRSMIGYIDGRDFDIGNVRIDPGDTQEDWATVTLTAMQGSFDQPHAAANILLVATGLTENTNMQWTDSTKSSVGTNWGESPSTTEAIPATITLPYPADRTQAWTLDETGQRDTELTVTASGDESIIEIGGTNKSLWYEIAVESGDPYLGWREQTWTDSAEFENEAISGKSADPDGDKILNFVEFLAGLDPKSKDKRSPIQQTITWIDQKPAFVYSFLTPIGFPHQQLGIASGSDLEDWSALALDASSISIATEPHNETHQKLIITHQPAVYPAFSRLTSD
ncbi:carbohydrate binding domain-containing protein [Pelagicoccus mobilis]|uniref:Carbohydrate binding domain-containing protein n=1 Tax=Pelagicoccus mobilis TaxID=415221 RepID=A0A934RTP9_9BACT|nr:carbohydrate binding domain-containing protein [Pelagicoccus mobilis]MBK1876253.1 carbohydrate binding domain-containing protein [Pelagicoccus mobilis]